MYLPLFPFPRRLLLTAAIVGLAVVPALRAAPAGAEAKHPEKLTREEVLRSLEENRARWQASIRQHSPRLYLDAAAWTKARAEIDAEAAPRSSFRDKLFETADKSLETPVPTYVTPEEYIKRPDAHTKSLYSAQEELWQRAVGDDIFGLAVAVRLKPDEPRYRTRLHDLVIAALGYDTWGRNIAPKGNADLAAGHICCGIATAYDWHRGLFTPEEQGRIRQVISERVPLLLQGLYGTAFWASGYEENHNQVSVAGLGFCGVAFYDEIPDAPEWLAAARLDFQNVLRYSAADGSSVEGISYWAYGVSFTLQFIEATRQVIDSADLYQAPFLRHAAAARAMCSTSGLVGNVIWGDAVPKDWSSPRQLIYRLAAEYRDADAAWFADHLPVRGGSISELALGALWARNVPPAAANGPASLDGRLLVNDMVNTRSGWGASDYLLSFKGGFTNRNHGHLDAGALTLAFGEEWLLVGPAYGRGSGDKDYWQRTGPRFNYFSNSTESHATLLINGKNQRFDGPARGDVTHFFSSPAYADAVMDLSQAYQDVKAVSRELVHVRGDYALVFDRVEADAPVTAEWLAQFYVNPKAEEGGSPFLRAEGKNGKLRVGVLSPAGLLAPRTPTAPKVDVKQGGYFSYAAKQTGPSVGFVSMLQPIGNNNPAADLSAQAKEDALGMSRVTVNGPGWRDDIVHNAVPKLTLLPQAPPVSKVAPTGTARLLVLRQRTDAKASGGGTPESFLALEVTTLNLPGFTFRTDQPCDLSARRAADGAWEITASRDVKNQLQLPAGTKLRFTVAAPEEKL